MRLLGADKLGSCSVQPRSSVEDAPPPPRSDPPVHGRSGSQDRPGGPGRSFTPSFVAVLRVTGQETPSVCSCIFERRGGAFGEPSAQPQGTSRVWGDPTNDARNELRSGQSSRHLLRPSRHLLRRAGRQARGYPDREPRQVTQDVGAGQEKTTTYWEDPKIAKDYAEQALRLPRSHRGYPQVLRRRSLARRLDRCRSRGRG